MLYINIPLSITLISHFGICLALFHWLPSLQETSSIFPMERWNPGRVSNFSFKKYDSEHCFSLHQNILKLKTEYYDV